GPVAASPGYKLGAGRDCSQRNHDVTPTVFDSAQEKTKPAQRPASCDILVGTHAANRARFRTKAAQLPTTRSCCSSVSSGNIGSAKTQRHASSLAGKSPSWYPR